MQASRRKSHQSHAWRSLFKKQFHKTKLCRYYNLGQCRYGEDCPFAHHESELSVPPDLTKTTMCEAWIAGHCPRPSNQCQYAHGEEELRVTPVFSASTICKRKGNGEDGSDEEDDGPVQPAPRQQAPPMSVGPFGAQTAPGWPMAAAEMNANGAHFDAGRTFPVNLDFLGSADGGGAWADQFRQAAMESERFQGSFQPPSGGKGGGKSPKKPGRKDKQAAVVHLADHLMGGGEDPRHGNTQRPSRRSAMPPRTSGTEPQHIPAQVWPPAAGHLLAGAPLPAQPHLFGPQMLGLREGIDPSLNIDNENLAASPMAITGASVPPPPYSPFHQMFGIQEAGDPLAPSMYDKPVPDPTMLDQPAHMQPNLPVHNDKLGKPAAGKQPYDLVAYCAAALADAQTATPGSLASASAASASNMRWARTPSSAASPERTGRFTDRTESTSPLRSPHREHSPAYVAPVGMVDFHELPEEEASRVAQEPPLSPEMRWARTPSTVASPSVSPQRRLGGRLRVTNRGPPNVAPPSLSGIHNLGSIFQNPREPGPNEPPAGLNGGNLGLPPWGSLWQSPPLTGPSTDPLGPQPANSPLGSLLGTTWGGSA